MVRRGVLLPLDPASALEKLRQLKALNQGGGDGYVDMLDTMDPDLACAYHAALNDACLCVERDAAEMIEEWAERGRSRVFHGDAKAFRTAAEDLFRNHFRKIRDGLFRPAGMDGQFLLAWRDGGLTGGRTFPQLCAAYLMNLVPLRILTGGKWNVPAEDWKYLAQYLKLNLPAMKKRTEHEWNIEPSEEVILKFIGLFHVGKAGEDCVHLECWNKDKTPEYDYLTYEKSVLARFMQDNITEGLFFVHGQGIDDAKKESNIPRFNKF